MHSDSYYHPAAVDHLVRQNKRETANKSFGGEAWMGVKEGVIIASTIAVPLIVYAGIMVAAHVIIKKA